MPEVVGGLPVRREEKRMAELLQAGAAVFAEGGFKGGNDVRYRGARRSVDQIARSAGLLNVVSLKMGDHCSFCAERGRCEHMLIFMLTKTKESSHLCHGGNDARQRR